VSRTWQDPLQRGKVTWLPRSAPDASWRDKPINPKREILPSASGHGRSATRPSVGSTSAWCGVLHVDEIDPDKATTDHAVAAARQPPRRFKIGAQRGLLMSEPRVAGRVQSIATSALGGSIPIAHRPEAEPRELRGLDLGSIGAGKKRHVIPVALDGGRHRPDHQVDRSLD